MFIIFFKLSCDLKLKTGHGHHNWLNMYKSQEVIMMFSIHLICTTPEEMSTLGVVSRQEMHQSSPLNQIIKFTLSSDHAHYATITQVWTELNKNLLRKHNFQFHLSNTNVTFNFDPGHSNWQLNGGYRYAKLKDFTCTTSET